MVSRRVLGIEHEARTHLCKTMADLGWECVGRTPKGVPNEFEKMIPYCGNAFYVRTALKGKWRLEQYSGYSFRVKGFDIPKMNKIETHQFETPVAMALYCDLVSCLLKEV